MYCGFYIFIHPCERGESRKRLVVVSNIGNITGYQHGQIRWFLPLRWLFMAIDLPQVQYPELYPAITLPLFLRVMPFYAMKLRINHDSCIINIPTTCFNPLVRVSPRSGASFE
jgi:hypothetical protein